ncbi:VirD4-like conjugal transfer protein, CD1115 family [Clostridium perfringens]|uniref:VirD4-like conjugal transfer protein, CD1115 family n=1 Tax=Clostridium perfringens TaxID=1502 RepID=UPI0013E2D644|nr:type IV secretory system conjugative DNA transfer family protein [Clostridium perfringens]MDZ4983299.1 type IV secretion system DNA-binding domain-containing protein [Clostridium perfringens]NGT04421.1 type IV secretory system conjugative DNA transfer family protein [Clostridium perfringens]
MSNYFKNLGDALKSFISDNKKVGIPTTIVFTGLSLIIVAYNITNIFNKMLGVKNYSFKMFVTQESYTKNMAIIASILVFLYVLYLMFFNNNKTGSKNKNDLGNAQIRNERALSGLTGNDGMLLSKKVQLKSSTCFEHIAIIGPTGSGKSSTFFIPNLLNLPADASMVISDPKGELYQKTKAYNESIGRQCILFAPLEPEHSEKYNPLDVANTVTEIREIAQNLLINGANAIALATGKPTGGDSEWINMAVPLWTAALLFVKSSNNAELCTITGALNLILEKDVQQLDLLFLHSTPDVKAQYNIFKQASGSEKTAASIKTVLASNLQLFTDPAVKHVTSATEFHPYILKDKPTAIYIMCPERRSSYASPFMSCFYSQIINKIMEYKGKDLPVYMMLDEFSNIGVIPNFAQLAATCRSRKLSLTVGIQGIEQLHQNYGKETGDNILNNLKAKIFYPGLAPFSAGLASSLCGNTTVNTESTSKNKDSITNSISAGFQRRELMDADEIRRLPSDEVLLILHNREPVIDKQNKYYESKRFLDKIKESPLPIKKDWIGGEENGVFTNGFQYNPEMYKE